MGLSVPLRICAHCTVLGCSHSERRPSLACLGTPLLIHLPELGQLPGQGSHQDYCSQQKGACGIRGGLSRLNSRALWPARLLGRHIMPALAPGG